MDQVELQRVGKRYLLQDKAKPALQDVSFVMHQGEFLCVVGPTGCGKSTLLRLIAGIERPSTGEIINVPRKVGFVPASGGLMPWLSVYGNLIYGLVFEGETREKRGAIASRLLVALNLMELEKQYPHELTAEQRQRVSIGRALASKPELLVLDDPFSQLSELKTKEMRDLILQLWDQTNVTILMATSAPEEAALLADRVIVLSERPGTVAHDITNRLKRSRDIRDPEFFKLQDRLARLIYPNK